MAHPSQGPRRRPTRDHPDRQQYLEAVVANIAINNLGTSAPAPRARFTILATIAFAETIVEEARAGGVSEAEIAQIILATLIAALDAARDTG